jgi:hypothetical protein
MKENIKELLKKEGYTIREFPCLIREDVLKSQNMDMRELDFELVQPPSKDLMLKALDFQDYIDFNYEIYFDDWEGAETLLQAYNQYDNDDEFIDNIFEYFDVDDLEDIFDFNPLYNDYKNKICIYNYVWTSDFNLRESDIVKSNLYPFYYDDKLFIALGTLGMDMSPNLDYLQFITTNSLPYESTYFTDKNYFKSIIGKENFDKLENTIKQRDMEYTELIK